MSVRTLFLKAFRQLHKVAPTVFQPPRVADAAVEVVTVDVYKYAVHDRPCSSYSTFGGHDYSPQVAFRPVIPHRHHQLDHKACPCPRAATLSSLMVQLVVTMRY